MTLSLRFRSVSAHAAALLAATSLFATSGLAAEPPSKSVARPEGKSTVARPGGTTAAPATTPAAAPAAAVAAPTPAVEPSPTAAPTAPTNWRAGRAAWAGFYIQLGVGYGTLSGEDGPQIPDASSGTKTILLSSAPKDRYDKAITTNRGDGLGANLTFGYNIKGYASIALDLAWQGSFGAKTDTAGIGVPSLTLGVHPLRFWRDDLDYDVRLYGGYGVFEINYYYENQLQADVEGKSWTGTSLPFGLAFTYRIPKSTFVVGLDVRYVMATYDTWIYNFDDDIKSDLPEPVTTSRVVSKLLLAWHF